MTRPVSQPLALVLLGLLLTACLPSASTRPSPSPAARSSLTPSVAAPSTERPAPTTHYDDLAFLDRPGPATLRVMSYNVNWDSIFPADDAENHELRSASRVGGFQRTVAAINPDIICLQEINPKRDPLQVSSLLQQAISSDGASTWQAASRRDSVIVARFPVSTAGLELVVPPFPRELPQAAALIDLPNDVYGPLDVYLVCAHFKAGSGVADIRLRQRQADVIMRQVGDALAPGGNLDLPAATPLVILGDFNVYDTDPAEHLATLLTGDIENEDQYGPDVSPDWDRTGLADASPSHNGLGQDFYTWRNDPSPFNRGSLDRVLYSDSVLAVENAFILNTTLLSEAALAAAGLRAGDVVLEAPGYYDHLPLVVDFSLAAAP